MILDCPCGFRLNAPGAVPGRVGKCPRCGTLIRVPGPIAAEVAPPRPVEVARPRPRARPSGGGAFVGRRGEERAEAGRPHSRTTGLIRPPASIEDRWVVSLGYPFWSDAGVGLLAFLPPLLLASACQIPGVVRIIASGSVFTVIGIVWLVPVVALSAITCGYLLLWLGRVVIASTHGEVEPPRAPAWDFGEIAAGLGRWAWAGAVGLVVGLGPALAYWVRCGDVDWFDRVMLLDLALPGLAYAQMAAVACQLFESPMAANPVTVLRAIVRAGWGYLGVCLASASLLAGIAMLGVGVSRLSNTLAQVAGAWAVAVFGIYALTVQARRIGLFCLRRKVAAPWFRDRALRAP